MCASDCHDGVTKPPPRGFEPLCESAQVVDSEALTQTPQGVLPDSLPDLLQNDPDLALIVERWSELPEAVRAGILAMVRASKV